jgi:hypothetical protein
MQIATAPAKAIAPSQFTERTPKLLSPVRLNAGILKLPSLITVTAMNRTETNAIKAKANRLMLILVISISYAANFANIIFSVNYLRFARGRPHHFHGLSANRFTHRIKQTFSDRLAYRFFIFLLRMFHEFRGQLLQKTGRMTGH